MFAYRALATFAFVVFVFAVVVFAIVGLACSRFAEFAFASLVITHGDVADYPFIQCCAGSRCVLHLCFQRVSLQRVLR